MHFLKQRPWVFDLGSRFYAWFTANPIWEESCARLAEHFPAPRDGLEPRVLDLGCGPGVTAIALAQVRPRAKLIGVDLSPRMLGAAQRAASNSSTRRPIRFVLADAHHLPFANASVDVVAAHSFLYLVPNRSGVLKEAYRCLRPGGRYVSMEPRKGAWAPGFWQKHRRHLRFLVSVTLWRPYSLYHGRFDERSFPEALNSAGFKNPATETVMDGLGIIAHGEK